MLCNNTLGVAFGPGFPLIRAQALGTRPVSAVIPNVPPNPLKGEQKKDSFVVSVSAKQLRAKRAERWWACARQGHREFCRSEGQERTPVGQKIPARGSARLRGKGLVRQRSLFSDLIFCYFLIKAKSKSLPRRMSGPINSGTPSMRGAEMVKQFATCPKEIASYLAMTHGENMA